jgi:3-phosphoshikimate 1-carboxyvinyltransferase
MSSGKSLIENLSGGDDVVSTINCLRSLGVTILRNNNLTEVSGRGMKGLRKPEKEIFAGNSGTTARLMSGLLAVQDFPSVIIGDASLSRRPMQRLIEPLKLMGAEITSDTGTLPIRILPSQGLNAVDYKLVIPSAQVKSAIILAGLHLTEETRITEYLSSRDHTERMLNLKVEIKKRKKIIYVSEDDYPQSKEYHVPSDISTAVFFIIAALILKDSELVIKNVSLNPSRSAVLDVLKNMGGDISIENLHSYNNEPSGNLTIRSSELKNKTIPPEIIPDIIDEIPALTVAGLFAEGEFSISGAEELRHKESDRITSICTNLMKAGIPVEEYIDGFSFNNKGYRKNLFFSSFGDHRIAMAFAMLSMLTESGGIVEDFHCVSVSNPHFLDQLKTISEY